MKHRYQKKSCSLIFLMRKDLAMLEFGRDGKLKLPTIWRNAVRKIGGEKRRTEVFGEKPINAKVKTTSANPKTEQMVQDYKKRTEERRSNEKKVDQSKAPRKIVEVLVKNSNNNNMYTCPNCKKKFKPQGIAGHVRSCAKA